MRQPRFLGGAKCSVFVLDLQTRNCHIAHAYITEWTSTMTDDQNENPEARRDGRGR
jgi:hypothetical protein